MFSDNFAGERGGAILLGSGTTFTLTGSTLTANKAGGAGGAISNFATCNVANSTIAGNMAGQIAGGNFLGSGGGIENADGTINLTNTTISGNMADNTGGGIENDATLNVTNSTIAGNSTAGGAGTFPAGGGIHSVPRGGMFPTFPFTTMKSSIVALNTSTTSPDVAGNVISNGFNLIGKTDGSTGFTATTDRTGTIAAPLDPKLDPNGLQSNGGLTTTIALLLGSPAIDKGTSAGLTGNLTTDQRGSGFPRIFDDLAVANAAGGDGTDIGAFELQTAQPTTLANISTRLRVETGDNVLIGGFIITGPAPKKVIVRAIGPSLPVPGKLENPTLELHGPGGLIASNDNWREAPNRQEIIDSTIAPTNDLESAILTTLPANGTGYTAIVRGTSGVTGVGLVEVYDLEGTANSNLANISSRGFVQTGDNVMIGGFILIGTGTRKVIVRAIGPSLPVPGALVDPTLDLVNASGVTIASNDNWRSDQEAEIIASTVPPTNDFESAIVATLPPTAHTAILRGRTVRSAWPWSKFLRSLNARRNHTPPLPPFREGLEATIDWYLNNRA